MVSLQSNIGIYISEGKDCLQDLCIDAQNTINKILNSAPQCKPEVAINSAAVYIPPA